MTTIAVKRNGGTEDVNAPVRWSDGGLFIHPYFRQDDTFANGGAYVIAHTRSGYALHPGTFKRLRDAKLAAAELLKLGAWDVEGSELSKDRTLAANVGDVLRAARLEGLLVR